MKLGFASACTLVGALAAVAAACGGGVAAPTRVGQPTATATKALAPTQALRPTPAPTPAPWEAPAGRQPQYGGMLIVQGGDPPNYDMLSGVSVGIQEMIAPAYNLLVQQDPFEHEKISPDLAESWETSPDGLSYTFRLRKGVKFHDGSPFNAEVAKFNLDWIYNPPKDVISARKSLYSAWRSVEIVDENAIRVNLKNVSASFLPILGYGFNFMLPKHIMETDRNMKTKVVGTGPYKFKEHIRGNRFVVEKNPNYWRQGLPYLDGITFISLGDSATAIAAFVTRQVHLGVPQGQGEEAANAILKQAPWIVEQRRNGIWFAHFTFNVTKAPWSDVRVRRAAFLALDRQASNQILQGGSGFIGLTMPPGGQWALPQEEVLKLPGIRQPKDADIAEAKRLLAAAGYSNGFTTKILSRTGSEVDVAVFVQSQLEKIGIKAELEQLEGGAFFAERMPKADFETYTRSQATGLDDPDIIYGETYVKGGGSNFGRFSDPKVEALFAEQTRTLDPAKRKQLVLDMQRAELEAISRINLYWIPLRILHQPEVKGFKAPDGFRNILRHEYTWLLR